MRKKNKMNKTKYKIKNKIYTKKYYTKYNLRNKTVRNLARRLNKSIQTI